MLYVFGDYSLDPTHYELRQAGRLVPIEPRVFEVLAYLVQHAGQTVTTEELLAQLYPQQFAPVERLTNAVTHARKALGETSQAPRYIQTVRRRGYRFLAPVEVRQDAATAASAQPPPSRLGTVEPPYLDQTGVAVPAAPSQVAPPAASLPMPVWGREPGAAGADRPPAERRQLTVLFCDLVDSTRLAGQLDPEDLREVIHAYHGVCTAVIQRFDGHIAQYLGDGLLVYFGYPLAHDDDAQRAVRAGLGIVEALGQLNAHLAQEQGVHLAVRLGIHTGLVVVGEVGGGTRQEQLALGETPHIAARLQGIAAPNTLVISGATLPLLGGFFACQPFGTPRLKGVTQPLAVYRVLYESMARGRLEAAGSAGLTPLVGREQEIGVLRERWAQVKDGVGQVVLLSGEAGIGKSRLVQVLTDQVAAEPQAWLTPCQCSPYYQHTALYPWIDLLERVALRFDREESPQQKVRKLEGFLVQYGLPLAEAVPLFATLLSLPLPAAYAPLSVSPEQQKQRTLHALLTILLRIAARQPVLLVMEDLHWVDPSTLDLLSLLVDQGPTARILALFTFRPDFTPPWTGRAHLTPITLPRLPRQQTAALTSRVAHGKVLPAAVVAQVVAKTDGVPLFVEELTKMVLESDLLQEQDERYALTGPLPPLSIPATLHDSLMARLDRLGPVKSLAQLGATLGREFASTLLQAVSPWDEETVQRGLQQLVEAEFLYQRGVLPQATYLFKHALIQEAAYQSLLRSTRQQYHQRIAQVLEAQFPDTVATQPELLAHHYTEAGWPAPAVRYWHCAGQRALSRSAPVEAISHLQKGLEVLATLPETPTQLQQELDLQIALGPAFVVTRGPASPAVEQAYARAQELCQQMGETPQHFPVLWGLWRFYNNRAEFQRARALGERLLRLAQQGHDAALRLEAHHALWSTLLWSGELAAAHAHLEQGRALYDPQQHHAHALLYGGHDPGVCCFCCAALSLWLLGYPDQALQRLCEALTMAQSVAHPPSLAPTLDFATMLHQSRREPQATHERAEALLALATEQGFAQHVALATIMRGWALAAQGHGADGTAQMRQGLTAHQATGTEQRRPYYLALLAEAYGSIGQPAEGLSLLAEALATVDRTGERWWGAELHRLQGELLLAQAGARHQRQEAEACLHQALDVARRQQAKSWELRAAMSLGRLWRQQGKRTEAHQMLAEVYDWFTEGFDTADLQQARALLDELA
jgi:class 3 adenylate cyclase/predicted ATPase/DNA-binding winged helix-turn-helix (wHTH) protein